MLLLKTNLFIPSKLLNINGGGIRENPLEVFTCGDGTAVTAVGCNPTFPGFESQSPLIILILNR